MRTSPHSGLAGMRGWWVLLSLGVRLSGLAEIAQPSAIQWKDITLETGIQFTHTDGNSGKHYIVETVSSGLATFDFDKDGVALIGAPAGCSLNLVQPTPLADTEAKRLNEAFFSGLSPGADFGVKMASRAIIACP